MMTMGPLHPFFRRSAAALSGAAVLAAVSVAGCTSTGGVDMAAALEQVAAEPALPETTDAVPTSRDAEMAQQSAPVGEAVAAASFVPVGYAGSTPAGPKASVFAEGGLPIGKVEARSPELDRMIAHYAGVHEIPESLLRRVVNRESTFNPAARNGPYWGLMQILPATARTMGYKGPADGLLDAETNLKYAGKYLKGAYLVADGNHDRAVQLYARGYYYDAKRKGLLKETGLR